ncbi:S1C family serine protease [Chloroflexota bacterium]
MTAELSQSAMNAADVYQEANQAVVRITDGEREIGSGFIIDDEGHVLTAYHVIENLTEIVVVLADESISTATVKGSSRISDVAILTLEDAPAASPLSFANSATISVGQPVVTIGSPFDLTATLTSGIVSQLDRFIEIELDSQTRGVANLIQFDAPVNPGNSGCPLLNSMGEIIGMVIARVRPEDGDGIHYAVSSNKLKRVSDSLINQGSFDYPWLGVEASNLTPQEAKGRGLDTINGVLVSRVVAGGPAASAEVKVNDIIVAIDGEGIGNIDGLTSYLGEHASPGEEATITLMRDGASLELSLTIGKQPS